MTDNQPNAIPKKLPKSGGPIGEKISPPPPLRVAFPIKMYLCYAALEVDTSPENNSMIIILPPYLINILNHEELEPRGMLFYEID